MTHSDQDLYFLLHDKQHVAKPGQRIAALDAMLVTPHVSSVPLYRGLHCLEVKRLAAAQVGDIVSFDTYVSLSENRGIAEAFADSYGTSRVIEIEPRAAGFALWYWGVRGLMDLKMMDPDDYQSSDGDFLSQKYLEESEWIFGMGWKLKVVAVGADYFPTKLRLL